MGMHRIRDELEDLSFEILNIRCKKTNSKQIEQKLKKIKKIFLIIYHKKLQNLLSENNIKALIYGRQKTPFSIWSKVQKKRVSLEQITDIIGFRIILENIDECYHALGVLHKKWNCIPGKFKDYISSPKINGYKSLHTSVIGSLQKTN
jgi:(p)ppGpp synthase/HD superfamily hydrolase